MYKLDGAAVTDKLKRKNPDSVSPTSDSKNTQMKSEDRLEGKTHRISKDDASETAERSRQNPTLEFARGLAETSIESKSERGDDAKGRKQDNDTNENKDCGIHDIKKEAKEDEPSPQEEDQESNNKGDEDSFSVDSLFDFEIYKDCPLLKYASYNYTLETEYELIKPLSIDIDASFINLFKKHINLVYAWEPQPLPQFQHQHQLQLQRLHQYQPRPPPQWQVPQRQSQSQSQDFPQVRSMPFPRQPKRTDMYSRLITNLDVFLISYAVYCRDFEMIIKSRQTFLESGLKSLQRVYEKYAAEKIEKFGNTEEVQERLRLKRLEMVTEKMIAVVAEVDKRFENKLIYEDLLWSQVMVQTEWLYLKGGKDGLKYINSIKRP